MIVKITFLFFKFYNIFNLVKTGITILTNTVMQALEKLFWTKYAKPQDSSPVQETSLAEQTTSLDTLPRQRTLQGATQRFKGPMALHDARPNYPGPSVLQNTKHSMNEPQKPPTNINGPIASQDTSQNFKDQILYEMSKGFQGLMTSPYAESSFNGPMLSEDTRLGFQGPHSVILSLNEPMASPHNQQRFQGPMALQDTKQIYSRPLTIQDTRQNFRGQIVSQSTRPELNGLMPLDYTGPTTYLNRIESHHEPIISQDTRPVFNEPMTSQNTRPVFNGPRTSQDTRPVFNGPMTSQDSRPVFNGPMTSQNARPVFNGPMTSQDSRSVFNGPMTSQNTRPVFNGPMTSKDVRQSFTGPMAMEKFIFSINEPMTPQYSVTNKDEPKALQNTIAELVALKVIENGYPGPRTWNFIGPRHADKTNKEAQESTISQEAKQDLQNLSQNEIMRNKRPMTQVFFILLFLSYKLIGNRRIRKKREIH